MRDILKMTHGQQSKYWLPDCDRVMTYAAYGMEVKGLKNVTHFMRRKKKLKTFLCKYVHLPESKVTSQFEGCNELSGLNVYNKCWKLWTLALHFWLRGLDQNLSFDFYVHCFNLAPKCVDVIAFPAIQLILYSPAMAYGKNNSNEQ